MKNLERDLNIKNQIKLAKVFKAIISAGLVAPVFVSVSACERAKSVIEESETAAAEATIPETTAPPETTSQETTPPTTEVMENGPIEYEGMIINPVEGLRFDNGTFYYLNGNLYGGRVGAEAGKAIPNALEFNKEKIPTIAFSSEVINFWQHKFFEQEGKLFIPIPLDGRTEGIQIDTVDNRTPQNTVYESSGTSLLINAPIGTNIYAPLKTELREGFPLFDTGASITPQSFSLEAGVLHYEYFAIYFGLFPDFDPARMNYEFFGNVDQCSPILRMQGTSLLPPFDKAEFYYFDWNDRVYIEGKDKLAAAVKQKHTVIPFMLINTEIGEPLAEIINEPQDRSGFSGPCSVEMYLLLESDLNKKSLFLGDNCMLEIGGYKVSILPANE